MAPDRMQRQRFEFKYLLSERKAEAVRDYVGTELELDEAGVGKEHGCYRVNSLYLDSENLVTFWDWVNSNRNRFKLRMRFYDEAPDTPVFFEIKRRVSGCILKQRCAVRKSAAPMVLDGLMPDEALLMPRDPRQRAALDNFVNLVLRIGARPTALVTYLREAYVNPKDEGVRLTMDREVRIGLRKTPDFVVAMERYEQPFGNQVILELKFNNRFPNWFGEMVRALGLTRSAAAKYCEGMAALRFAEMGNWPAKARLRHRPSPFESDSPEGRSTVAVD